MMPYYQMCTILVFLVALQASRACLPMDDVFKYSSIWMQAVSVPDRHLLTIGQDDEKKTMEVKTETGKIVATFTCIRSHGDHQYMMLVQVPNEVGHFQCVKFTPLTQRVVRISKSAEKPFKEKLLDCEEIIYTEEAAVLIAYLDIPTQPCPLQGGYQMLLRQTDPPDSDVCMRSGWPYNPSLHFECSKSRYVVAQFGHYCVPEVLNKAQKMRRRYLAHLRCVGSWTEEGKGDFVLLQMRDMYATFWCMNMNRVTDEILSVYLTFDGRCSQRPQQLDASSRHGRLVRYIPPSDMRCDSANPPSKQCNTFRDQLSCFISNNCPRQCNRCVPKKTSSRCKFMSDTAGQWSVKKGLSVDVGVSNFTMSDQGKFECSGEAESSLPGKVYPVVQYGRSPSCLPYHACSQVLSPAPGLLNFFLRPAALDDGRVLTCTETDSKLGHVIPVKEEKEFTMLAEKKLERTTCNVPGRKTYPSHLVDCDFAVEECSGTCDTLVVGLDLATCGNDSSVKLETNHVCHVRLSFEGGHHGIVARAVTTHRFHCWIFTKDEKLYIAPVWQCNSKSVRVLLEYYVDEITNGPMEALLIPMYETKASQASCLGPDLQWITSLVVLSIICLTSPIMNRLFVSGSS